jgi:formylglycine-generating enzyme required for sulfatase activity
VADASPARPGDPPAPEMVWVPGGAFLMGSDHHYPEEAPAHQVRVDGFWIDRHTVTNDEFARFVRKTGYVTVAEQAPDPAEYPGARPELLVPASTVFRAPAHRVDLGDHYNWWTSVPAADRGRVGAGRPRRSGWGHLRLGRGAEPGWAVDGQHLAGRVHPRIAEQAVDVDAGCRAHRARRVKGIRLLSLREGFSPRGTGRSERPSVESTGEQPDQGPLRP